MNIPKTVLHFLTLPLLVFSVSVKKSGIYIDNGDQTIFNNVFNEQHTYLGQELMKILDIPIQPKQTQKEVMRLKRSATSFLMDIYKLNDDTGSEKFQEMKNLKYFDVSDESLNSIHQSDMIISLAGRNSKYQGVQKSSRVKRLWFNTSQISAEDKIIQADLKLYRSTQGIKKKHQGIATISVFRIASDRYGDNSRDMVLVDVVETSETDGWVTLNVTESLFHWIYNSKENRGLYLMAKIPFGEREQIRADALGFLGFDSEPEKQPFMIVYISTRERRKKRSFNYQLTSERLTFPEVIKKPRVPPTCAKQHLYVNFRDYDFDFIIAPDGYVGNYCFGYCNFPLSANLNATNHAHVQALVNLMNPDKVSKPCCVPIKTSTFFYFYMTDQETFIMKGMENMIVDSCGCL